MDLTYKAALYFHTIKYLQPIQIWGQIKFKLFKPRVKRFKTPLLQHAKLPWITSIPSNLIHASPNSLQFLNKLQDVSQASIWNQKGLDKLWLYQLHYFDILKCEEKIAWHFSFIDRWIKENPYRQGIGWDPYPVSLRVVNWIKWILAGNPPKKNMLDSIAHQSAYLYKRMEIHILGNHLLANAKALMFAGLFFSGKKATLWFKKGFKCFSKEIKKQIDVDGGHKELSPMYHAFILEDFLDIINLFKVYRVECPNSWEKKVNRMFLWLKSLSHPDRQIAFFNDAVLGMAPSLSQLESYANRLNLPLKSKEKKIFNHSGFIRLKNKKALLIADLGEIGLSYQPGHAHADSLSFELSVGLKRLFVNSGISTYNEGTERLRQRGTAAHNTLTVNDQNSSIIWKSFRVAKRAKIHNFQLIPNKHVTKVSASHDGYYDLYKVIHRREWQFSDKQLVIIDEALGKGQYKISIYFHVHPDISVTSSDQEIHFFDNTNKRIATLSSNHAVQIEEDTHHPQFNVTQLSKKLVIESLCFLPIQFKSIITWK